MPTAIITITTTMTITDPALIRLLMWLSPTFPTGGFAYSHGLEWAIEAGDVRHERDLAEWVADILAHGAGRTDAILLRHAYRAPDTTTFASVAELAVAAATCRERQTETLGQGGAFAAAAHVWGCPRLDALPPGRVSYPVAIGALASANGIGEDAACLAFLQGFSANLVSAGVRLVPLGQTAGLRALAALEAAVLTVAEETRAAMLDDIGGCAFRADIAAMRHETQYTRLFRS